MHRYDAQTAELASAVLAYAQERMRFDPAPLDAPMSPAELAAAVGETVTPDGLGGAEALRLYDEVLARACISTDHPRYLSFIPAAPTRAAVLFDLVVGASSIYGGSWLEGAGAVFAENQALRWLADLAGMPASAGGVFVPGGTVGNLSALVTARDVARRAWARDGPGGTVGAAGPPRWSFVCGQEAHSSLAEAARVMDVDVVVAASDGRGRLTGATLADALDGLPAERRAGVFAVVATAGTTQFGLIDDLRGVTEVAGARGLWVHADGAYGLAALAAPSVRHRFDGLERVDSLIVDPHKWLFAPFDACALVYREPQLARVAHTQQAGYLSVLDTPEAWNPSDYAIGLSRRARGLPFWFSLAVHGTRAYTEAIERALATAAACADQVRSRPYLELVGEPELSVVVFRRIGWTADDYHAWSGRLLRAGFAFVTPTVHRGETLARFAIVSPLTTAKDTAEILDTLRA
ncbi:pyridoxal phosphate-dependent decarboxylase family protein [Frankia nepalensis]|uniref:Aspartate aminotransferase family protein n=1 Tax=Frankia nepalensis TaxID=1836974 RepID=A0A937URQ1_9ACTN|nr:pyridoxal-dependent decarboxylase [Frankia nepalensis]MBL7499644.1 aspartate aminotransferase family protein [Frankia nepalensis]MBL7514447.1 aspartate aminotransferase family protein [Frankia nepalensis]MBL7628021.1 aspartate aminotransferase family protein [Frankia nepalensis]